MREYFDSLNEGERWGAANMTSPHGETLLMSACRRASGPFIWQILTDLIGYGADCMVCCDSGKTFIRDLLWANGPPPIEQLKFVTSTLKMLASTLSPHDLMSLLHFPCTLNFTAFDYLDRECF